MKTRTEHTSIGGSCKPEQLLEPELPGQEEPALTYAFRQMDASVAERFDAIAAQNSHPITLMLRVGSEGAIERGRDALRRLRNLTIREAEVLNALTAGRTTKAVALDLGISAKTVGLHHARIMDKLGCTSSIELGRMWEAAAMAVSGRISIPAGVERE
ncbi:LuxR C-terminal-related transcriptional regulator (plasmid) [Azospirillum sp. HJ39]|uniref:LuxR C-terminal-related transcriptional regulator n=1 Tax=Azospirillum sp. HJ39 TaxID=3159496 RepID=UPI0035583338